MEIIIWIISTPNDRNNHTGKTQSNFVNALLSLNARIANILSVGFQMTVSHKVMKIQNIIRAFASDKNIISAQIFLFSVLLMLEKNKEIEIRHAMSSHTKWKLKFCGLSIVKKFENDDGIYVHVSKANDM